MRRRPGTGTAGASSPKTPDPHRAALALLARRDFACGELAQRLERAGHPAAAVAAVIADLRAQRLLDDARFATQYVAYHADRGQGPRRIAVDLGSRGVAPGLIEAALAGPDWAALARQVRSRRFGATPPASWAEKAKQGRFLQYRGFSSDHVRSALGPDFELEDSP